MVVEERGGHRFFQGFAPDIAGQQALSMAQKTVLQQAAIMSYQDAFVLMGVVFLITMPLLLLFEKRSPTAGKSSQHVAME